MVRASRRIDARRGLSAGLGLSIVALALAAAPPASAAVEARSADAFVESVGVNVHLGYTGSPYSRFNRVRMALADLGARYIRDGVGQGRSDVYARLRALSADGVRVNIIVGDPRRRWGTGTLSQQLDMIERELRGAVVSLEGPNEYDIQGDPRWVVRLRGYQRRLWEGANSRPALAPLPVLAPSLVDRESYARVGSLAAWSDYGNIHPYPGGDQPDLDSHLAGELSMAVTTTGSQRVQATETGYHNAVGDRTAGHRPASERASGIYIPRLFLEYFRRGVKRTFAYELIDAGHDPGRSSDWRNFGLLRSDFSRKPAFRALKRLIALLSDRSPAFKPGSLAFGLEGAPPSARQLLLQKRDGSFYLLLWNRTRAWSTERLVDLDPADQLVTLRLDEPIARAVVYRPNDSAAPVGSTLDPSRLSLPLSEKVIVVRLTPRSR